MLLFDRTKIYHSSEKPVATGSTVTAEGAPLVADYSGNVFSVKMAVNSAADKFVGISYAQQVTLTALPYMETVTVPAGGGTVSLSRTNLYTGTVRAVGSTSGALTVVASPAVPATNEVSINYTNGTATFHADEAGETVTIGYRYQPTTVETLTVQGANPAGGSASFILNSVGVIESGEVYTTEYNMLIDWATAAESGWVVAAKDGMVTAYATAAAAATDNAVLIPNARIVAIPATGSTAEYGWGSNAVLGIQY